MSFKKSHLIFLFLLGWPSQQNLLASESLHSLSLKNLTSDGSIDLKAYNSKLVLLSFFQPDCRWCHRQMKALTTLTRECSDTLQPLAVGIYGNSTELRREISRAKINFPAVKSSAKLLKLTGPVPATPTTILFDTSGSTIGQLRGYIRFKKLLNGFKDEGLC